MLVLIPDKLGLYRENPRWDVYSFYYDLLLGNRSDVEYVLPFLGYIVNAGIVFLTIIFLLRKTDFIERNFKFGILLGESSYLFY